MLQFNLFQDFVREGLGGGVPPKDGNLNARLDRTPPQRSPPVAGQGRWITNSFSSMKRVPTEDNKSLKRLYLYLNPTFCRIINNIQKRGRKVCVIK